jgi:hypothetical protein
MFETQDEAIWDAPLVPYPYRAVEIRYLCMEGIIN